MIRSVDPQSLVKASSALARKADFDGAIDILKQALPQISASPLTWGAASYSKIIPYFQKAGHYSQGVAYTLKILVPTGLADIKRKCSHVPSSNSEALGHAFLSEIYGKLSLIAKREGMADDQNTFLAKQQLHREKHRALMEVLYPRGG